MNEQQLQLFDAVSQGLPLVAQPYLALANQTGMAEQQVMDQIELWQQQGLLKRFGMVVRHRKLGYVANAMVVWDIEDNQVEAIAVRLAAQSRVTLCYQRPRVAPNWPYNLFCMIHGKSRGEVLTQLDIICSQLQLHDINKSVLFSTKAFKQQGGRYARSN